MANENSIPVESASELELVNKKIDALGLEIESLRDGYTELDKRYFGAISTLKTLTDHAAQAADCAARSAEMSLSASKHALEAVEKAVLREVIDMAQIASTAAQRSAESSLKLLQPPPRPRQQQR